jgi:hypothetical protein
MNAGIVMIDLRTVTALATASALLLACSSQGASPSGTGAVDAALDAAASSEANTPWPAPEGGPGHVDATAATDATANDASLEDAGEAAAGPPTTPNLLSQTGLFRSVAASGSLVLASGVNEYEPLNPLWSDGAQKTRWVYLPPGSQIDTSNPDHWRFPAGTKFWKEFALDGKRLETRLLWIYGAGPGDFLVATYWWNPEAGVADDAELVDPFVGAQDVNGTTHDIPSQQDCHTCHDSLEEHVLGFGAIELNHTQPGVNIHTLLDAGLLAAPPNLSSLTIPGDATAQAALGYLHTNCGICHNATPGGQGVPAMILRLSVGTATVQATGTYQTAVNQPPAALTTLPYLIAGQEPAQSEVLAAMSDRGGRDQMPPLASKAVDTTGVAQITAWVQTLPKP